MQNGYQHISVYNLLQPVDNSICFLSLVTVKSFTLITELTCGYLDGAGSYLSATSASLCVMPSPVRHRLSLDEEADSRVLVTLLPSFSRVAYSRVFVVHRTSSSRAVEERMGKDAAVTDGKLVSRADRIPSASSLDAAPTAASLSLFLADPLSSLPTVSPLLSVLPVKDGQGSAIHAGFSGKPKHSSGAAWEAPAKGTEPLVCKPAAALANPYG